MKKNPAQLIPADLFRTTRLLVAATVAIAYCSSVGCSQRSGEDPFGNADETTTVATEPRDSDEVEQKPPQVEVIELTIEEIRKEHAPRNNGKLIQVTGTVVDLGSGNLLIASSSPQQTGEQNPSIWVYTKEPRPWEKIGQGSTVTVVGSVGINAIDDAEIISFDGSPVPMMTAAEILEAVIKDWHGTKEKFNHKPIVLTGTVKEANMPESVYGRTHTTISAEGFGLRAVSLDLRRDDFQSLKPGDEITVFGHCSIIWQSFAESGVHLDSPVLIETELQKQE